MSSKNNAQQEQCLARAMPSKSNAQQSPLVPDAFFTVGAHAGACTCACAKSDFCFHSEASAKSSFPNLTSFRLARLKKYNASQCRRAPIHTPCACRSAAGLSITYACCALDLSPRGALTRPVPAVCWQTSTGCRVVQCARRRRRHSSHTTRVCCGSAGTSGCLGTLHPYSSREESPRWIHGSPL